MAINAGPKIVEDGLTFCIDAANKRSYSGSGSTVTDMGKNRTPFTLSSTSFNADRPQSFLLDGTDDHIVSTDAAFLKWQNWNQLSFTVVFKHLSAQGNTFDRVYIFDSRTSGGGNGIYGLFVDNASTQRELTLFYNKNGGSGYEEPTVTTYNFNEWYIYTFTIDKTTSTNSVRHYLNGVNVFNRSLDLTNSTENSGSSFWIGRYSGGNYRFHGHIPYMSAHINTILTPEQAKQNYEALRWRFQ